MYYLRYGLDIALLTIILAIITIFLADTFDVKYILVVMSFLLAVGIIDIGMNTNARMVIDIATGLYKIADWLSLKIIDISKNGITLIKSKKSVKK